MQEPFLHARPQAGSERRFGLCSTLSLVCARPQLVSFAAIRHPRKTLLFLSNTHVAAFSQFLDLVPEEVTEQVFSLTLTAVSLRGFRDVIVPLLNNNSIRETLAAAIRAVDANRIIQFVDKVPVAKLEIVLTARADALGSMLAAVHDERYDTTIIPVLSEEDALLRDTLVPVLTECRQPRLIGILVNNVDAVNVLLILRGVTATKLKALLDALSVEDVEPTGCVVKLVAQMAEDGTLVQDKLIPFLQSCAPDQFTPIVRRVETRQLLEVFRRLEADDIVRLLANTDQELVIRIFDGPLENIVPLTAGTLAAMMRDPRAAKAVNDATKTLSVALRNAEELRSDMQGRLDHHKGVAAKAFNEAQQEIDKQKELASKRLNEGVAQAGALAQHLQKTMQETVDRGMEARGCEERQYQFGDFARGLLHQGKEALDKVVDRGMEARGSDDKQYQFGDFTRGFFSRGNEATDSASSGKAARISKSIC